MHDDENLRYVSNKIINLTPIENEVLKTLIENKGHITTYERLIEVCKNKENARTKIKSLRKKLKGEIEIVTKTKLGYCINKQKKEVEYGQIK